MLLVVLLSVFSKPVVSIKKWFMWETDTNLRAIAAGAFLGTFSHVMLDSFLYTDMEPFYPADGNPFYNHEVRSAMFILIYGITAITTLALLVLYARKCARNDEMVKEPEGANGDNENMNGQEIQ